MTEPTTDNIHSKKIQIIYYNWKITATLFSFFFILYFISCDCMRRSVHFLLFQLSAGVFCGFNEEFRMKIAALAQSFIKIFFIILTQLRKKNLSRVCDCCYDGLTQSCAVFYGKDKTVISRNWSQASNRASRQSREKKLTRANGYARHANTKWGGKKSVRGGGRRQRSFCTTSTTSNDTKRSIKIHDAMRCTFFSTFNRIIKCGYYGMFLWRFTVSWESMDCVSCLSTIDDINSKLKLSSDRLKLDIYSTQQNWNSNSSTQHELKYFFHTYFDIKFPDMIVEFYELIEDFIFWWIYNLYDLIITILKYHKTLTIEHNNKFLENLVKFIHIRWEHESTELSSNELRRTLKMITDKRAATTETQQTMISAIKFKANIFIHNAKKFLLSSDSVEHSTCAESWQYRKNENFWLE